MKRIWTDLLRLFFPKSCCVCGRRLASEEKEICLECLSYFIRTDDDRHPNETETLFIGKAYIENAYAMYHYDKGEHIQRALHALKYHGCPRTGYELAHIAASELAQAHSPLCDVDVLVPVPLHPAKKRQRGYNQAEWIARGLAAVWGTPIDTRSLVRTRNNSTQTRLAPNERWENTRGIFRLARPDLAGKHVLLIDDVITTGATLSHCAEILLQEEGTRVSIFALARV